jgi:hypothetical protein
MPRVDGPYKILEKINDNAYKLQLHAYFGVSPTFNIADLKPYLGYKDELESMITLILEGVMRTSPYQIHSRLSLFYIEFIRMTNDKVSCTSFEF